MSEPETQHPNNATGGADPSAPPARFGATAGTFATADNARIGALPPAPRWRTVVSFLALRRSVVGLLGMVILVGMGERMADRFLPLYLLALGGGDLAIGLLGGFRNLASALYSLPGGYLSDRLGTKRALLVFNLIAILGYVIVIFIPTWTAVIGGAILFLSWSAISLPATMELLAQVLPKSKRTMGVTMVSLIRRLPMALGPILGGAFIQFWGVQSGIRYSFLAALAMALVSIVLQQRLITDDRRSPADPRGLPNLRAAFAEMNRPLRDLLVSDILIRYCEQIPDAFVVVWATTHVIARPVTELQFGYLTAVEMATAVLCYIPVAYLADRVGKKPFVLLTFVFFTCFPLVLLAAHSLWPLMAAFVVRGLKEFGEPTRKALILDLAPEGRKAIVFGVYYLIRDTVVSVAAFGGAALWMLSPKANLVSAFAFGVLGTVWFAWRGRDLPVAGAPKQ